MTHWNKHAKQWKYIGTPLRPSVSDIQTTTSWIKEISFLNKKPLSVLLLGVTPELVNLSWPERTTLFAVDNNLAMLNTVLPVKGPSIKPLALAGCWLALPFATASIDLVIGDGCYSVLTEKNYDAFNHEIVRVLSPSGHLIMRFFIRPEINESLELIHQDLQLGKLKNFHVFKWRLTMALHGTLSQGVCLKDVWENWNKLFKKDRALIKKQSWTENTVRTINNYKNVNVFYTFPTLSEMRCKLAKFFNEQRIYFPRYMLGERCPTLNFRSSR